MTKIHYAIFWVGFFAFIITALILGYKSKPNSADIKFIEDCSAQHKNAHIHHTLDGESSYECK